MQIEFDPVKRAKTLEERGLDFSKANLIFAGKHLTREDIREDYDEQRFQTAGWLDERIVILIWTPRGEARRIISMRKANEREITKIRPVVG
jgi:uncharacterized DUF497 family protein